MVRPVFASGFLRKCGTSVCLNVSGLLVEHSVPGLDGDPRTSGLTNGSVSLGAVFFDQAWDVWVDRSAILFEVTCRTWREIPRSIWRRRLCYTGAPAADGRYTSWRLRTAQAIRAILLATATTNTLRCARFCKLFIHTRARDSAYAGVSRVNGRHG